MHDDGDSSNLPMSEEPTILLAEDSVTERQALARILRDAGYVVDEAEDGKSVLLYLSTRRPDLLLLDLHMPGTDGFGVLAHIQKHMGNDFPVLLMSGLTLEAIQKAMGKLPSRELPPLLLKPVDPAQLLNVVALKLRGELPA